MNDDSGRIKWIKSRSIETCDAGGNILSVNWVVFGVENKKGVPSGIEGRLWKNKTKIIPYFKNSDFSRFLKAKHFHTCAHSEIKNNQQRDNAVHRQLKAAISLNTHRYTRALLSEFFDSYKYTKVQKQFIIFSIQGVPETEERQNMAAGYIFNFRYRS